MTNAEALTEMRAALDSYRYACREYVAQAAQWDHCYGAQPLTAASRKAGDPVLAEIAAEIGMFRADAAMWAAVAGALAGQPYDEREAKPASREPGPGSFAVPSQRGW